MGRLYIIGDRQTGVLLIQTNPLRLVQIPLAAIEAFAAGIPMTTTDAFSQLGAALKAYSLAAEPEAEKSMNENDLPFLGAVRNTIAMGGTLSDAEFCYITNLSEQAEDNAQAARFSVISAQDALETLFSTKLTQDMQDIPAAGLSNPLGDKP